MPMLLSVAVIAPFFLIATKRLSVSSRAVNLPAEALRVSVVNATLGDGA
ncbi:hypothetical protein [Saccharopolyspora erythraea]|nr:hypothetical protein [Saccharopolyspora erythraea]